ncbi:hypothetical protein SEA_MORGANA_146 [Gordonia phage Morgana]|uniref:Uncharacterized protein n=1 Tax=Gordonia phage Morgana TaxID=3137292 RepID=A0AAX4RB05_9CAUD
MAAGARTLEGHLREHRPVDGPYTHPNAAVRLAWIECACGWRSEREPRFHPGIGDDELHEALTRDHERHIDEVWSAQ